MDIGGMLKEFSAAVEAGDGKRLAALFTTDGIYHDTFYGEFKGADAIRDMLENRFWRDAEKFRWDFFDPVSDGRLAYATWAFSYTSKMPQNTGKRVAFEGVSQLELVGDQIKHYGEVFSSGAAFVQLGLDPARIEKSLRKQVDALRAQGRFARHFAG